MSSIYRCRKCATYFDTRRFPRCPICATPMNAETAAAQGTTTPGTGPGGPAPGPSSSRSAPFEALPGADAEARTDGARSGYTTALGMMIGALGLGMLTMGRFGGGAIVVLGLLLFGALIYGMNAREEKEPVRFASGQIARSAITTICVVIAGLGLLGAGAVVLLFVACVGAGPGGLGS